MPSFIILHHFIRKNIGIDIILCMVPHKTFLKNGRGRLQPYYTYVFLNSSSKGSTLPGREA